MVKKAFKVLTVFIMSISMLISCCACSGDGSKEETGNKPAKVETQASEQTDMNQTSNDVSNDSSTSEKNNSFSFCCTRPFEWLQQRRQAANVVAE